MKKLLRALTIFSIILYTLFYGTTVFGEEEKLATASAEILFDLMEKRTEKIDSIEVEVLLENSLHKKNCKLSIMNPDKFAIEFDDASIQVFFNGSKLWLKIAELKEVFYYFADSDSSILSYIPMLNPKKIFTNLTRNTLFTLFNIELLGQEKSEDGKVVFYSLKFTPKMKTVFKEVFSIGYYIMVFSDENYMPVKVIEYSPGGFERGRLIVKKYAVNPKIPAEKFDFIPPPGYNLVPFSVVFAQKLEDCGKFLINKVRETAKKIKESILNWGF
ncbi:MAG: hypothetical protein Kow0029_10450 [Candidatus Rifleibacteriota bacterium]